MSKGEGVQEKDKKEELAIYGSCLEKMGFKLSRHYAIKANYLQMWFHNYFFLGLIVSAYTPTNLLNQSQQ